MSFIIGSQNQNYSSSIPSNAISTSLPGNWITNLFARFSAIRRVTCSVKQLKTEYDAEKSGVSNVAIVAVDGASKVQSAVADVAANIGIANSQDAAAVMNANIDVSEEVVDELSTARARLSRVGQSKNITSSNTMDIDFIVRTVMRNPNTYTKELLYELHGRIASKLVAQSNDGLNWLLGGSSIYARGGFASVEDLRKFLMTEPKTIPNSRLITGLETILTALGYRHIMYDKTVRPYRPTTIDQKKLYSIFNQNIPLQLYSVQDHSESYSDSRFSWSHGFHQGQPSPHFNQDEEFCSTFREEISDGSDTEDLSRPQKLPLIISKKYKRNREFTWMGAALESNVPSRLGISGTVLRSLSVIEWLFGKAPGQLDVKILEHLSATLFIPTYHRGDYHSVAETTAAFQHFIASRNEGNCDPVLDPLKALEKGLSLMEQAVDPKYKNDLELLKHAILSQTKRVEYNPK